MDKRTLKALEGSITKWEANAQATDLNQASLGVDACPLCVRFSSPDRYPDCERCPVYMKTRRWGCAKTPYVRASRWYMKGRLDLFLKAARAEVKFLKSLLPVKEDQPDEVPETGNPVLPALRGD